MRVMIIGASNDRAKYGNKAVRAFMGQGHEVVPINPTEATVEGLTAYADVSQPAGPFERALLYVPPPVVLKILPALAARKDVDEVWFNPGTESDAGLSTAARLGLQVVQACSILDIGAMPHAL